MQCASQSIPGVQGVDTFAVRPENFKISLFGTFRLIAWSATAVMTMSPARIC